MKVFGDRLISSMINFDKAPMVGSGSIVIVAESETFDQAGTDRARAFVSSSKALLMSRMLMTPIKV